MNKCFELRVRETNRLSITAQKEVEEKLKKKSKAFQKNYVGFCVLHIYSGKSGLYHKKVEPIEGYVNNYFKKMTKGINTNVF